jgi:hypothetical protein
MTEVYKATGVTTPLVDASGAVVGQVSIPTFQVTMDTLAPAPTPTPPQPDPTPPQPEPAPTPPPSVTPKNRPTQPGLILYGGTSSSAVGQYAKPGALVICGRTNFADTAVRQVAAGGGTVLIYLDALVLNVTGPYHNLLFNSSKYGGAVPLWPGSLTCNSTGKLADFRAGGILQSKLAGVLHQMLDDNPHASGWFLDDCGSRSWYPGFDWGSVDQAAYRAGAVAICKTARQVADARRAAGKGDAFILVNGTWTGGSLSSNGGGYNTATPNDLSKHGNSLVDGGMIESHDPTSEMGWVSAYCKGPWWGLDTPRKLAYMFALNHDTASRDKWISASLFSHAAAQSSYDTPVPPWGGFTDAGMPRR